MRNEKVRGILLRLNSFGGEVDGVFDAADVIREAAKAKPVWASVDDNAFSAAYLLASQADRIYTTRTGGVGSVGVIAAHGYILAPGRYVGAEAVEDEDDPFEEKRKRLVAKREEQFAESKKLEDQSWANPKDLGHGS